MKNIDNIRVLVLIIFSLFPLSTIASSANFHYSYHSYGYFESGSAEAITADVLIARPLGLVATVVGSAVYVVSLPFSLLGGNEKQARQKLVREPAAFIFTRPLGEFNSLD